MDTRKTVCCSCASTLHRSLADPVRYYLTLDAARPGQRHFGPADQKGLWLVLAGTSSKSYSQSLSTQLIRPSGLALNWLSTLCVIWMQVGATFQGPTSAVGRLQQPVRFDATGESGWRTCQQQKLYRELQVLSAL
jgi:hypothetical protein